MFPNQNNSSKPNLKFGLNVKKGAKKASSNPKPVNDNIFGEDEDEEAEILTTKSTTQSLNRSNDGSSLSKSQVKDYIQIQEALEEDPQVFDYDAVYDSMKASERAIQELKKGKDDKKPRYIKNIFEATELRKRDRLRAEEKMLEKERIKEGEMFKDKEKFVTSAYKKQLEELRKSENDDNMEDKNELGAMTSFYKGILDDRAKLNEAAKSLIKKQLLNETEKEKVSTQPDMEKDRLQKALQAGAKVELNDDNQVVDKRQLLSAGLNINLTKKSNNKNQNDPANSAYDEFFQRRQSKLEQQKLELKNQLKMRAKKSLQLQLEQNTKETQQKEEEKLLEAKRTLQQRNDTSTISDAKRRYLERKQNQFLKKNLEG